MFQWPFVEKITLAEGENTELKRFRKAAAKSKAGTSVMAGEDPAMVEEWEEEAVTRASSRRWATEGGGREEGRTEAGRKEKTAHCIHLDWSTLKMPFTIYTSVPNMPVALWCVLCGVRTGTGTGGRLETWETVKSAAQQVPECYVRKCKGMTRFSVFSILHLSRIIKTPLVASRWGVLDSPNPSDTVPNLRSAFATRGSSS